MSEDEVQSTELWTPPEKLNPNVAKMAWALFLAEWKSPEIRKIMDEGPGDPFDIAWGHVYRDCIKVAKALEDINQDPGK